MLTAAKVGVAMANAIPAVKAATTHATLSNDADGVAVFLENYFNWSPTEACCTTKQELHIVCHGQERHMIMHQWNEFKVR